MVDKVLFKSFWFLWDIVKIAKCRLKIGKYLNKIVVNKKEDIEIFKKIRYRDISDEELAKWIKNEKDKDK